MKIKYIGPKDVFHGFGQSFEKGKSVDVKDANTASDMLQHPYFEEDKGKSKSQSDKDKLAASIEQEREAEIEGAEEAVEEAEAELEEVKRK